jgi:hypothetical protein
MLRLLNIHGWAGIALCLSLALSTGSGCFLLGDDEVDDEEEEVATPASNATQPASLTGGDSTAPAAPPPQQQLSAAILNGPYELQWIEGARGRQPMPATLLQQMPGCIWGRWLWQFGPLGELTVHNELLCEDTNLGTGICRAEFQTRVQWQQDAFVVPAPIHARSHFVNLRPQNGSWPASGGAHNTTTIRCNVNLSDVTARLTEIVPGTTPNRPQAVTLDIGNGERIRLVAAQLEVDHAQIMLRHTLAGAQPPAVPAPPPSYPQQ